MTTLTAPSRNLMVYQDVHAYLNLIYFHRQMDSSREHVAFYLDCYREFRDKWFLKQALFWMKQIGAEWKAFQEVRAL